MKQANAAIMRVVLVACITWSLVTTTNQQTTVSPGYNATEAPTTAVAPVYNATVAPINNVTQAPTTAAPINNVTQAPTTAALINNVTQAPTTAAPINNVTQAPTTAAPINNVTQAPTAAVPINNVTQAPTTAAPINNVTQAPTAAVPINNVTQAPTTSGPTTAAFPTVTAQVIIKIKDRTFNVKLLERSSTEFKDLQIVISDSFVKEFSSSVLTNVRVEEFRPGSIEATILVDLYKKESDYFNRFGDMLKSKVESGVLGQLKVFGSHSYQYLALDCKPPIVAITNLGNSTSNSFKIKRSEYYTAQTSASLRCNDSDTKFTWNAWLLKPDSLGNYVIDAPRKEVATGTSQWTIKKLDLPIGLYLVSYQVTMVKKGVTGIDFKYLAITQSELLAEISGGPLVKRGFNKEISLDASPSRDPDVEIGNYNGMTFTWLCKKKDEGKFLSVDSSPVISPSGVKGKGGCFDTGIGKLEKTSRIVKINTGQMKVDTSYVVKLVVSKTGKSNAEFEQQIDVVEGDPPQLSIICIINCGIKMNPSSRLKVASKCTSPEQTCQLSLNYQWSLSLFEKTSWKQIPDLSSKLLTSINSPDIVVKERSLQNGEKYQLTVTASSTGITTGTSSYVFTTNVPPQGGSCDVTPSEGTALKTEFTITCQNWKDDDNPIQYQFYYVPQPGLTSVLYYGPNPKATTKLPLSKPADNNLIIYIHIIDSLSAFTEVKKTIKINLDQSSNEETKTLIQDSTKQVESLLKAGDVKQATQLANAALDTMTNSKGALKPDEKAKILGDILKQVTSNVKPENLQTLTQITSVIGRATLNPDDVTTSMQDETIKSLNSMTTLLNQKSKDSSASEDGLVDAGGENLALCLGNVMKSSSSKATYANKDNHENKNKNIKVAETSVTLVGKVGKSLLNRKVIGEKPSVVVTTSLSMVLSRQRPEDLYKKPLEHGGNSFVIPSKDVLGTATAKLKSVDSQVTFTEFNPFTWDSSAGMIQSNVNSLVMRGDNTEIPVEDLSEDIEITIAHSTNSSEASVMQQSSFIKPGTIRSYRYYIQYPGMAVLLEVTVEKQTPLILLVRRGLKPTATDNDLKSPIKDLPNCQSTLVEACKKSNNVVFLSAKVLKDKGVYFVSLYWDTSVTHSRKKRSCFGRRRQKRSCVEPKEAPSPQNITIIPVYDAKTDVNYTLSTQVFNCLYWDSKISKWSSEGCKAGPKSNRTKLQCLCNHLTSFGGSLLVEPNPIDFDKVLQELLTLDETGNVAVLSTILVFFFVYFVIAIIARRADRRDIKKYGPPIPLPSRDSNDYHYELIIQTGVWRNSGTTSNVALVIHGDDATSQQILLSPKMDQSRLMFSTGSTDKFMLSLPYPLGSLVYLNIRHDNSGPSPSWWLKDIVIKDNQTDESWLFLYQDWLALEKGDGQINKILLPISQVEKRSFNYNFNDRTTKKFTEDHLWLSVLTKPPHSTFTRLQRATCCLTVLFAVMVVNAMFYKTDQTPDPRVQVGPLKFSWRQIRVGIISSLMVIPVGMGTVFLFQRSRAKVANPDRKGLLERLRSYFCCCCKRTYKISDSRECLTAENVHLNKLFLSGKEIRETKDDINMVVDKDIHYDDSELQSGKSNRFSISSQTTKDTFLSKDGHLWSQHSELDELHDASATEGSTASLLQKDDQNNDLTNFKSKQSSLSEPTQQNEQSTESIKNMQTNQEHNNELLTSKETPTQSSLVSPNTNKQQIIKGSTASIQTRQEDKNEKTNNKTSKFSWLESVREILTENFSSKEDEEDFSLPHYCIYISWVICIITILVSASFTFIYSLQWGKEIANQWLSSILISFSEDLFVIQPVKIFLVAIFLSCFMTTKTTETSKKKKTPRNSLNLENTDNTPLIAAAKKTNSNASVKKKSNEIKMKEHEEVELEKARDYQTKENAMFSFVRELIVYGVFLTLLTIVCYGNRSYLGYMQTKAIKNDFNKFTKISKELDYWKWSKSQFFDSVFAGKWYNGKAERIEAYIGNKRSILVGMPRIRQLRVKPESCIIPEKMRKIFKHCYGEYSMSDEDQTRLYLPQWKHFTHTNLPWSQISKLCPIPWRYSTAEELSFYSTWGYHYLYSGGGYVADLGYNSSVASHVTTPLQTNRWFDRRTRALILEFAVFNPSSNQLSVVTFYYEVAPTMFGTPFQKVETMTIYPNDTGANDFFLICKLIFIFFVLFYLAKEARRAYKLRAIYFKDVWNWFEILQILMAAAVVVCYIVKEKMILDAVQELQANPFITVNFHPAVAWKYAEDVALSIAVFIATVKILRMVRFNPHVIIFNSSLRRARSTLMSFSVILFIIMTGYAILGHLVLGSTMTQYGSFKSSLYMQIMLSLGKTIGFTDLNDAAYFLGPLMNMTYKMLMAFYFLNFYIAVINDSYEDTRSNTDFESKEFEMSYFIVNRIMDMFFKSFKKARNESSIALSEAKNLSMATLEDEPNENRIEQKATKSVSFSSHEHLRKETRETFSNDNKMSENKEGTITLVNLPSNKGKEATESYARNQVIAVEINIPKHEDQFADKDDELEAQIREIEENVKEPVTTELEIISETETKHCKSKPRTETALRNEDRFTVYSSDAENMITAVESANLETKHKILQDKKKSALNSKAKPTEKFTDNTETKKYNLNDENCENMVEKSFHIYEKAITFAKEDKKEDIEYLQCICHLWRNLLIKQIEAQPSPPPSLEETTPATTEPTTPEAYDNDGYSGVLVEEELDTYVSEGEMDAKEEYQLWTSISALLKEIAQARSSKVPAHLRFNYVWRKSKKNYKKL